ncbi:MAG: F0F1 ATP synthase subunit gamma [Sphingomonadaceae bacterium]
MTRRHQLAGRLAGLREVRAILSAMKNIALMELRALAGLLEHQRRAMATIERAAADFLCFHPPPGEAAPAATVCIVVGSERGFCGEFNEALEAEARAVRARGDRLIAVGTRLADRLEEADGGGMLAGANVAEELPAVLQRVATELEHVQRTAPAGPLHVKAVYQNPDGSGPLTRTIAPLPLPERPPRPRPYAPRLTLAPPEFFAGLLEQALLMSLQEAFSVSLIAENRRRLEQMEGALRRLDEITSRLAQRLNASRQEEITQEIEVIMLSAEALSTGA